MASHELRFLQIQVSMEQGKILPGAKIMDHLTSLEYVSTISVAGDHPEYILCLRYKDEDAVDKFSETSAFEITRIIEQRPGYSLIQAISSGPLPMLVHSIESVWLQTPSLVSGANGLFLTVHGTTKGLKEFRDGIAELLPPSIKIRISKDLKADWIAAPQLPSRRKEVMELAVKLGYYSTPRKCTQRVLAENLGVRQGTVAEHLQSAESTIIQSWAEQAK
jgi:predicted DNA binding protein